MNIRQEFENWYAPNVELHRSGEGYKYASIQAAWVAFKAGYEVYDKSVTDGFDCVAQVNSGMGGIEWLVEPLPDDTQLYVLNQKKANKS